MPLLPKPSTSFQVESIPTELTSLPCWVLWRPELRDGKWTKVPYQPENPEARASSMDPKHWGDFETASGVAIAHGMGIGFVVSDDIGIVGIDFDKSLDDSRYREWINRFNSYTEISPSGNGYRIFVFGSIPKALKRGKIECYSSGRYLTVTGNKLDHSPSTVRHVNGELVSFFEEFQAPLIDTPKIPVQTSHMDVSEVLSRIRDSKQASKFDALYGGSSDGYASASEADAAMLFMLAFWCQRDSDLLTHVALSSRRVRDKWFSKRGGVTWLDQQIQKAIGSCSETYSPKDEPEKETDSNEISTLERLYLLFEDGASTLTPLQVTKRLGINRSRVSQLLKEDRDEDNLLRKTKIGKKIFISMRKGQGFQTLSGKVERINTVAQLPADLNKLLQTRFGGEFRDNTFFGVMGYGDRGKSQFLLNLAISFARQKKKVAYLRHEVDETGFYLDVGQRILGRTVEDTGEVIQAMKDQGLDSYLKAYVAPEEANLDDFCEEVVEEIRPDIVVYDYLSQELVDLVVGEQRSIIAAIVNKLADNIVSKRIPLFTAVQVESESEFAINAKWIRRMNIALHIIENKPIAGANGGRQITLQVKKNKDGGLSQGDYIRIICDPTTWDFVYSYNATNEVKEERLAKK